MASSVYKVDVIKTTTTVDSYEVIANSEHDVPDKIYWFESSGSPSKNIDARKINSSKHQNSAETKIVNIGTDKICDCGHFTEHHGEEGCLWNTCKCRQKNLHT